MKIGTFWCWLFGHKFVGKINFQNKEDRVEWDLIQTNWCIRCGIDKK